MNRTLACAAASLVIVHAAIAHAQSTSRDEWPQWGGPSGDFVLPTNSTLAAWGPDGPKRLWSRPLGDGFSAVITSGRAGFTTYREGELDVALAFEIESGRTIWETKTRAPFNDACSHPLGPVPRATPLVSDRWLFTASSGGLLTAIEIDTGKIAWQRELFATSPESLRACGYSSSPIAYGDTVIVLTGAPGRSITAFRKRDGTVVWQRHDFANGYSSPILVSVNGRPELVALMAQVVVGLEPATGAVRWQHPHSTAGDVNVAMPVVGADGLVFLSSGYDGGARVLELTRDGDNTTVRQLWEHKRFRVHFGTLARLGDIVVGSNGDFGPAPFTAVDVRTGKVLWRDRAFSRASFVLIGNRAIVLDEDGLLALATISSTGMTVEAKAQVFDSLSWTPPTVSGDRLLLRNRTTLTAFALR